MDELPLGLVTVHCFACPFTVERATPDQAHEAMEEHYAGTHREKIREIVGWLT